MEVKLIGPLQCRGEVGHQDRQAHQDQILLCPIQGCGDGPEAGGHGTGGQPATSAPHRGA
jgi:hypothetical protein